LAKSTYQPQQGDSSAPQTQQQQGQQPGGTSQQAGQQLGQQSGKPIFRDWASI